MVYSSGTCQLHFLLTWAFPDLKDTDGRLCVFALLKVSGAKSTTAVVFIYVCDKYRRYRIWKEETATITLLRFCIVWVSANPLSHAPL